MSETTIPLLPGEEPSDGRVAIADPEDIRTMRSVADRYFRHMTPWEIAGDLNMPVTRVYGVLETIRRDALATIRRDYVTSVAEETARLDAVERAAWEAWELSLKPAMTTKDTIEAGTVSADPKEQATAPKRITARQLIQEQKTGNPKYLDIIIKVIDRRIRLLGYDAPSRHLHLSIDATKGDDATDSALDPIQQRLNAYASSLFATEEIEIVARDDSGESVDSP